MSPEKEKQKKQFKKKKRKRRKIKNMKGMIASFIIAFLKKPFFDRVSSFRRIRATACAPLFQNTVSLECARFTFSPGVGLCNRRGVPARRGSREDYILYSFYLHFFVRVYCVVLHCALVGSAAGRYFPCLPLPPRKKKEHPVQRHHEHLCISQNRN